MIYIPEMWHTRQNGTEFLDETDTLSSKNLVPLFVPWRYSLIEKDPFPKQQTLTSFSRTQFIQYFISWELEVIFETLFFKIYKNNMERAFDSFCSSTSTHYYPAVQQFPKTTVLETPWAYLLLASASLCILHQKLFDVVWLWRIFSLDLLFFHCLQLTTWRSFWKFPDVTVLQLSRMEEQALLLQQFRLKPLLQLPSIDISPSILAWDTEKL